MKFRTPILNNRTALASIAAVALIGLSANLAQAAVSIGWNYQGVSGVGLGATDTAGAPGFEQDNWNNHSGAGQGPGAVPFSNLTDDSGAATTLDVTAWTSTGNSWQHSQTDNPNEILTNDFNNQQASITFGEIPFSDYDVVVYYGNNEGPSTSLLSVGALSRDITTGNTAGSSFRNIGFVEGTDLNTASATNYSVFNDLTSSSLTVSLTGVNNNGVSAIQIVQVPEPGTLTLLCAGLITVALRRKRR